MPGHAVLLVDQPLDERRRETGRRHPGAWSPRPARSASTRSNLVRSSATGRPVLSVVGAVDVALEQVFDLLLPPPALGGLGRALGVEAEEHGVAVGEELLDRLVGAERDVLALVILDDQVEPRGAVVEPELQLGLGQRAASGSPDSIWAIFSARYSALAGSAAASRSPGTWPLDAWR